MARVNHSLTMEMPPARAQEMFVRDIVPDLHRDGGYSVYREKPGELKLSDADFKAGPAEAGRRSSLSMDEIAEPDMFEAHARESGEPVLADVLRRGTEAEEPVARNQGPSLNVLLSMRLKVTFAPQGEGTRVTISGRAQDRVRDGLCRLGRPDHWPAIAEAPHD